MKPSLALSVADPQLSVLLSASRGKADISRVGSNVRFRPKADINPVASLKCVGAQQCGGSWDYDLGVIVKNSNELREFIHEFRKKFSYKVKVSDVFIVLEETSGYKLPEGVFKLS